MCSRTSTTSSSKGKIISAKITGKTDSGRGASSIGKNPSLDPPMSSVIVERHPPVNKVITQVNSVQCVAGTIVIMVLIIW